MQATVKLSLSDSGRVLELALPNGRIVAQILVHGPLKAALQNCLDGKPPLNGRVNIFRGELWGLAGYELLDLEHEVITEK